MRSNSLTEHLRTVQQKPLGFEQIALLAGGILLLGSLSLNGGGGGPDFKQKADEEQTGNEGKHMRKTRRSRF